MTGAHKPGLLKIYLGYAAGVGKTYKMLCDASDLRASGIDVVIGYFEPHGRRDTIAQTEGLETVPRRVVEYRGSRFEEMDTEAILKRAPKVCVVDEFPHTNVPGSERAKRWEDVQLIREAGIDVLTTMNIQHLESLNDQIRQITGIRVRETIPDWIMQGADEIVMIDVTPRALLNRLERGVVYSQQKASQALQNFFREPTLVALRELALRQTAHEVEHRLPDQFVLRHHRILVVVDADPTSAMVIRRARRVSDFLSAECFAVAVSPGAGSTNEQEREALERHLNFARNLRIETRVLEGDDVAEAVTEFARRNQITQIFIARQQQRGLMRFARRDLTEQIVAKAREMQVVIVSQREDSGTIGT